MEYLKIRWRWLDRGDAVPAFYALDCGRKSIHFRQIDDREIDVVIDRFVVVEGNLSARASGILFSWRCFRFAVAIGSAATLLPSEHKVLFAGDAASSDKSDEEKQRENRTGESPTHHSTQ